LAKKSGRNRLKRLAAPKGWDIERKRKRFVIKPVPGPHAIRSSYPLGVVVRDILEMAHNMRELTYLLSSGKVLVDGRARASPAFPVGLFDIITIPEESVSYRLLPSPDGLVVGRVDNEDADKKLCRIQRKVMLRGQKQQYGLHDGRNIIDDSLKLSNGDSLLIKVPEQKVLGNVKLGKETLGLVLTGERAGQMGRITDVKKGGLSREKMVAISLPSGDTELPASLVFPIGVGKPMIKVKLEAS
jgi:small subunit ribosomal protein S4e